MALTENLVNNFFTQLTAAIDDSQVVMMVASQAPAAANFRVLVEQELIKVTDNGSLTWTIERGAEGTTAAAHAAGTLVIAVLTAEGLNEWSNESTGLLAHIADATGAHAASAISVDDAGGYYTGVNVEAVLQEVGATLASGGAPLAAHIADPVGAHAASAISIVDAGGWFTAIEVEGALQEAGATGAANTATGAANTASSAANAAALANHLADPTGAHAASAISVVDAGGYFTSDQVEGVLQEVGAALAGGGTTPGGADGRVQYNDGGTFGGSGIAYDDTIDDYTTFAATWNIITSGTQNQRLGLQGFMQLTGTRAMLGNVTSGTTLEVDAGNIIMSLPGPNLFRFLGTTGDWELNGDSGAATEVLTSQGPGLPPVWAAASGSITEPLNQVLFGTGVGVDSSASLTFDDSIDLLTILAGTGQSLQMRSQAAAGSIFAGSSALRLSGGTTYSTSINAIELGNNSATGVVITAWDSTSAATNGGQISLSAGNGNTTGLGGDITISAGAGGATANGGNTTVEGGAGGAVGDGGFARLRGGSATQGNGGAVIVGGNNGTGTNRSGGNASISSGNSTGNATAGAIAMLGGQGGTTGIGGGITLTTGQGGATSGASGNLTLTVGATTDGNTGDIFLQGQAATGTSREGSAIALTAGASTSAETGGTITATAGQGGPTGVGGAVTITAGAGGGTSGSGGAATLKGGDAVSGSTAGAATLLGGGGTAIIGGDAAVKGGTGATVGGLAYVLGGDGASFGGNVGLFGGIATVTGPGGSASVTGGNAVGGNNNGGAVTISGGDESGSGTPGAVSIETNLTARLSINGAGAWSLAGDVGTALEVLTSNGTGTPPTWQAVTAAAVTVADAGDYFDTSNVEDVLQELGEIANSSSGRVWTFRADVSGTTPVDPGSGQLRWNNATQNTATQIYVDDLTEDGIDISLFIPNLVAGSTLLIQARNDATRFQLFQATANPTDNTGWWTIPVTIVSSGGGNFTGGQRLIATAYDPTPGTASTAAEDVTITDAGGYYTGTDVEAALQEIGLDFTELSRAFSNGPVRTLTTSVGAVSQTGWTQAVQVNGTASSPTPGVGSSTTADYCIRRRMASAATTPNSASNMRQTGTGEGVYYAATATNAAGFKLYNRFDLGAILSDMRSFVGLNANNGAMSASTDPSTLASIIGMGKDAADTNWQFMYNDASGNATEADTGMAVTAGHTYDLYLYQMPGSSSVNIFISCLDTGNLFSSSVSTNLPASDVPLYWHLWQSNGPTGGVATNIESHFLSMVSPSPFRVF